jgi:DNA-binding Lrp family transcriptional regulator
MDALDRRIVNELQKGFPLEPRPFAAAARAIGMAEDDLIARLERLLDDGVLTRFGPLYNVERLGGAVTLAAMRVPEDVFEDVAERVNAYPEVAHNYARDHAFNMWFVIAAETQARIDQVLAAIGEETGLRVYDMPKTQEFFVELRLAV